MDGIFNSGFGVVFAIALLILFILWVLLPFAVMSIQKRSIEMVALNRDILSELRKLNSEPVVKPANKPTSKSVESVALVSCPSCKSTNPAKSINGIRIDKCMKCGEPMG
jgi:hypothetical protein